MTQGRQLLATALYLIALHIWFWGGSLVLLLMAAWPWIAAACRWARKELRMQFRLAAVVLLVVALTSCSTATVGLMNRAAKPNRAVVESFLRMGRDAEAREYLIRFGLPEYEVMALIQEAREAVVKAAEAAKESR